MKKQENRPVVMVDVQEEFDRLLAHKYRLIGYLDDMVNGEMTPLRMKSISDRKSQIIDIDKKLDVLEKLFDVTAPDWYIEFIEKYEQREYKY
jgi:hypothetical protein